MTRPSESGVSLLNVLVVVAVASGLVQVMVAGQENAVSDLYQTQSIAQAEALVKGGLTSVAVALRRDMLDAPDTDHQQEDWAKAAQQKVAFDFGSYEVEIEDARGRLNLNDLTAGAFLEQRRFEGLMAALDLPETIVGQIIASLQDRGALKDPRELYQRGFAEADVARLLPHVTALQTSGPINLNSATPEVLSAVFANPTAAQALVARRTANGRLTSSDLNALGLTLPASAGFTSDAFDIALQAEVGPARRTLNRRILRFPDSGTINIVPIE